MSDRADAGAAAVAATGARAAGGTATDTRGDAGRRTAAQPRT